MFKKIICITPGNTDGVGLEVSYKALKKLTPNSDCKFLLFKNPTDNYFDFKSLSSFKTSSFSSIDEALRDSLSNLCIIDSIATPSSWFIEAVKYSSKNKISALCTGPLSKVDTNKVDSAYLGHTAILRKSFPHSPLTMAFLGKHFNVALLTDHIPLNEVPEAITPALLENTINNIIEFNFKNQDSRPIAILGLNPHAGESGLLGEAEKDLIIPLVKRLQNNGVAISDVLPSDTAFLESNWKKYSFYLAMYHDQGLIPFKMLHGFDSGVQITLNLPFIRLSVDHGTAVDIYNKNLANENSMLMCLEMAQKLVR